MATFWFNKQHDGRRTVKHSGRRMKGQDLSEKHTNGSHSWCVLVVFCNNSNRMCFSTLIPIVRRIKECRWSRSHFPPNFTQKQHHRLTFYINTLSVIWFRQPHACAMAHLNTCVPAFFSSSLSSSSSVYYIIIVIQLQSAHTLSKRLSPPTFQLKTIFHSIDEISLHCDWEMHTCERYPSTPEVSALSYPNNTLDACVFYNLFYFLLCGEVFTLHKWPKNFQCSLKVKKRKRNTDLKNSSIELLLAP